MSETVSVSVSVSESVSYLIAYIPVDNTQTCGHGTERGVECSDTEGTLDLDSITLSLSVSSCLSEHTLCSCCVDEKSLNRVPVSHGNSLWED